MTLRTTIATTALAITMVAGAQNPASRLILDRNPQLESKTAAALSDFNFETISKAEASLAKDNGGMIGIDGSSDSWLGKVYADSYARISDRMVFYGRLSYSYFLGMNMTGSVLRDMYYNPVAFLEIDPQYAGKKTRELFGLQGALSYALSDSWSLGFGVDYESGNNVKSKDPRYRTEWMDLELSAGAWFRPDTDFALGFSLVYRNTREMALTHVYGSKDKQYFFAIDRGAFFGTQESIDVTAGILSQSDFQPMTNHFVGGAFQMKVGCWYGELEGFYRKGKYGLDTSAKPVFFNFGGVETDFVNKFLIEGISSLHDIHFGAGFELMNNAENTIRYSTAPGGNTVAEYVGVKDVLSRKNLTANVGYTGTLGIVDGLPSMRFGADVDAQMRIQTTTIYPSYRDHRCTALTTRAFFDKYVYSGRNTLSLGASVLAGAGFGIAAEDGKLASSTGGNLKSFDALLNRQFEYETAPFAGAGLGITYSRQLKKRTELYVGLRDDFSSMLKTPEYLDGRFRNSAVLTIGLNL